MADQGQPLMTVPQTNLWGQAGDDLRTILANREVQRRKDLLESIKVQGDLQKQAIEGNESASKLATEQQNRQIAGAKAPADLAHLQAQTTGLDDSHAEAVAKQETRVALGNAMDAFDAATTPEERVKAAAHIKAHGGSLMTDAEVQSLNAPSHEEAIQKLILAYGHEKDPDKRQQIGMQMMNLGAKGVPTPDATPISSFGNGGLYDTRNAHVIQSPFAPGTAAHGTVDPDAVAAAKEIMRNGGPLPGDVATRNAVLADMTKSGEAFTPLTAAGRGMRELSTAIEPKIDEVVSLGKQVAAMGLMGTFNGRMRHLAAGESIAGSLAGLTDEQRKLVGKFETEAGLLISGVTLTHFRGRGGPAAYEIMKSILDPGGKDLQTYLGNLEGLGPYLKGYSNLGGITLKSAHEQGDGTTGGGGLTGLEGPVNKKDPGGIR